MKTKIKMIKRRRLVRWLITTTTKQSSVERWHKDFFYGVLALSSLSPFASFHSHPHRTHRNAPKRSLCLSLSVVLSLSLSISAALESANDTTRELGARERRRIRNERRESKTGTNWREQVEERLLKKPKKRYASWTEELNLDKLANLGPQWWVVRVYRVGQQESAELIACLLARNFPHVPFKVYVPAVQVKRRFKNGFISVKPKYRFPGSVFLNCVKEQGHP